VTGKTREHILVVEDDQAVRNLITEYLDEHDYKVTALADGLDVCRLVETELFDLVVLDLKLPDQDGFSLARAIRERSGVPIIMLTILREESERIKGLDIGADDYLTKPFSPRELLARIKAVRRRYSGAGGPRRGARIRMFRFAGWVLNVWTRRLVSPEGVNVELSNSEFNLLSALLRAPRQPQTRDQLLEASRLHDDIYDRSIDVQILRLRRKIEPDASAPALIKTKRGEGYYVDADVIPEQERRAVDR
jgi:two-component system, OmpR family, response regulator